MLDAESVRLGAMDHEGRDADRGEDVAHVALVDQANDRLRATGGSRAPLVSGPRSAEPLIVRHRWREEINHDPAAGVSLGKIECRRERLVRCPDGEIRSLEESSKAVDEDQARYALRMSSRERHRQDPTTDIRDHRRAFRADRVHDGRDVPHEFLKRRQRRRGDRVGEARSPLIEHDQPTERGEPFPELGNGCHVPLRIDMAEPLIEQQDVRRAFADNLVREVEIAEAGISGLRNHPGQPIVPRGDCLRPATAGIGVPNKPLIAEAHDRLASTAARRGRV
jgi:hypothetical protein